MVILTTTSLEVASYLPRVTDGSDFGFLRGGLHLIGNVGGFIGHGRGVDKGDEIPFALLYDAAEQGLWPVSSLFTL